MTTISDHNGTHLSVHLSPDSLSQLCAEAGREKESLNQCADRVMKEALAATDLEPNQEESEL